MTTCFVCRETPAPDGHACPPCAAELAHDEQLNHAYDLLEDQRANGWPTDDTTAYIERLNEEE